MGWYIRKGFNAGPFRLNLSRSGFGASFGVKGARIGLGPRGSYVHMGRGGLYYRQSLSPGKNSPVSRDPNPQNNCPSGSDGLSDIDSGSIEKLTDASSESIMSELNRVKKYTELFPIAFFMVMVGIFSMYYFKVPPWSYYPFFPISAGLLVYCRHLDVTNGTAILKYDLESDATVFFNGINQAFKNISSCSRVWHIEAAGNQTDWKRHGGADQTVRRKTVTPTLSLPPRVQSNIKVPVLPAGRQTMYFFPDRVLVYEPKGVGTVSYKDLQVDVSNTRFIEAEWVPHDSKIIDRTWQYVNKSGGPDRRFNNNREIPITQYEQMHFKSSTGLNELFMLSKVDTAENFVKSIGQSYR